MGIKFGAGAGAKVGVGGSVHVGHEYELCVVMGQSNCRGNGIAAQSPTGTGLEIHTNGTIEASIVDPVGQDDSPFQIATTGSIWPSLANEYYALTGKKLIILQLAVGGSAQHERADIGPGYWIGGENNIYDLAKAEIDSALTALNLTEYNYLFKWLIWFQGETDALAIHNSDETQEQYAADIAAMIGYFFADYSAYNLKFGVIQIASVTGYATECAQIQAAQASVAGSVENAFLAYDNDLSMSGWDDYTQTMYNTMAGDISSAMAVACSVPPL